MGKGNARGERVYVSSPCKLCFLCITPLLQAGHDPADARGCRVRQLQSAQRPGTANPTACSGSCLDQPNDEWGGPRKRAALPEDGGRMSGALCERRSRNMRHKKSKEWGVFGGGIKTLTGRRMEGKGRWKAAKRPRASRLGQHVLQRMLPQRAAESTQHPGSGPPHTATHTLGHSKGQRDICSSGVPCFLPPPGHPLRRRPATPAAIKETLGSAQLSTHHAVCTVKWPRPDEPTRVASAAPGASTQVHLPHICCPHAKHQISNAAARPQCPLKSPCLQRRKQYIHTGHGRAPAHLIAPRPCVPSSLLGKSGHAPRGGNEAAHCRTRSAGVCCRAQGQLWVAVGRPVKALAWQHPCANAPHEWLPWLSRPSPSGNKTPPPHTHTGPTSTHSLTAHCPLPVAAARLQWPAYTPNGPSCCTAPQTPISAHGWGHRCCRLAPAPPVCHPSRPHG